MANTKTVDFLPEIFQTVTNKQFLSATLDQLVQEPNFAATEGYIGRRIGSGVNANDQYVKEPTRVRSDYQLEPGVVLTDSDTATALDAITYPGMIDTLALKGSPTDQANRLFSSEYYAWDPMMDFDKFVNFSEYYWLPNGTNKVSVYGNPIPIQASIDVTRTNTAYTFDLVSGTNPTLTLIRGGSYKFNVHQNLKQTVSLSVTNRGSSAYIINALSNPTLTLERGNTYEFVLNIGGNFPFWIKTQPTTGIGNSYNTGVINNGASSGTVRFTVPTDAPNTLYYISQNSLSMQGVFNVIDAQINTGPKFWIQAEPGVDGKMPNTPNISSRDVYGVTNNGEDYGTVSFDVPMATAQNFYYTLDEIAAVDLVTTLRFSDINNAYVDEFIKQYGGIDGVKYLNNQTIAFLQNPPIRDEADAEYYGWYTTVNYSPNVINTVVEPGDYDCPNFSTTTPIFSQEERFSIYLINYRYDLYNRVYMTLTLLSPVEVFQKFTVTSGIQYSNTQWFKNIDKIFEQVPLLTAVLDTLYYQDSANPALYGTIRLISENESQTIFIPDIIDAVNYTSPNGVVFTNGLKILFQGDVFPTSYQNNTYYVEGVGSAIKLLPTTNFLTPEDYAGAVDVAFDVVPYDTTNYDVEADAPLTPDYLTINRASPDLNPWSRYNRWFHRQAITAAAEYNNLPVVLDQDYRARRPIIEQRAGLRLFDFGVHGKAPINLIDFSTTDALSLVNGATQFIIDGDLLFDGYRVIFANDQDPAVRNRIYTVQFITPDSVPPLISQPIINLVPANDSEPVAGDTIVCLTGISEKGSSFWFDGTDWIPAQRKSKLNQAPLFDAYDQDGISFGNETRYPSTTFNGTTVFTYAQGTGTADPVLGFPLKYLTINNVGDIVFNNTFYTDTFLYVINRTSTEQRVSDGFIRQYNDIGGYTRQIGWQTAVEASQQYQQFRFTYDGTALQLDIPVVEPIHNVTDSSKIPVLKVYVANTFVSPQDYTYLVTDIGTTIFLNKVYVPGDIVEVLALSPVTSSVAFYEIPINLANNPFNVNATEFTLGTVRSHYESIAENLLNFIGPINGSNNSRDLGNIVPHGLEILQQSSPLTLPGFFMRTPNYDIFRAIQYNSQEYVKFKNKLLDAVAKSDFSENKTVAQLFTECMSQVSIGLTQQSPFYWSDMLPASSIFSSKSYTYTSISTPVFDTTQVYDFTNSNYLGLNVYVNDILLTREYDFNVIPDSPSLEIMLPLQAGDVILIQEFSSTLGNFVPNTPTKMGLYAAYRPVIYLDNTYTQPTLIILGHDGSKTVAFNDIRDQVLLEFETRIFNNLKIVTPVPLTEEQVIPDAFTVTGYSKAEVQAILNQDFLAWVGWNRLDYTSQTDYSQDNPFSWNYSHSGNRLNGKPLLGAWRGIYLEFYGTISPNLTPWEMVGFSQEPAWWQAQYGPAPYTAGNNVLWDDMEAGRIADPNNDHVNLLYARPGLSKIIPAGPSGQLLAPIDAVVGAFDPTTFRNSWKAGDMAPVEYSWRASSSYPFAVMRLLSLTKPAEFFSLFADRDLYVYDQDIQQYLYNKRYRLDARDIEIYGLGISKASYINWIVDYSAYLGNLTAPEMLKIDTANLDVRLCYRLAGFSNKQYLKIFLEKPSPGSVNAGLLLPDSSFDLLLYKNQPFGELTWSSVIIQRVEFGWEVFGYGITKPYFEILESNVNSPLRTVEAGGGTVRVPSEYTDNVVQIPYGYTFNNPTIVVDFLLSYGKLLNRLGLTFETVENGYIMNWDQMAQEFLYWSNQGWEIGSIINLNPSALELTVTRPLAIVDSLSNLATTSQPQDQNRQLLPLSSVIIERINNTFRMATQNQQTISFVDLQFVNYEQILVMQNKSVFGDLLYQPSTGQRQNRLKLLGWKTTDWNGQLDAQGFVLNQDNVKEWVPNIKYTKGQIVKYKNILYSALVIIQPKQKFDPNDWTVSEYNLIQTGLLPNIANKANQLANSYNINQANLEQDNDLLSYGLTGFRPRQYMTSLDLDDVSQLNIYRQFTREKGTIGAVRLLTNAQLGKEGAEYEIYENWGILAGIYGAQDNRRYIDLRLNAADLSSNLSLVQVVKPDQFRVADQSILVNDVWGSSWPITSPDFLPTRFNIVNTQSLPTAGYVDIDETDIDVFDLNDPQVLNPYFNQLGAGTVIWVAAVNEYDWNIYRCSTVPATAQTLSDNLDGTCVITTSGQHGLEAGEIVIIKEFDFTVNGTYRVASVPSLYTFTIVFSLTGDTTTLTGTGLLYQLQTMRVAQAADAINLPYSTSLLPGVKIWVNNNGSGLWEVIEKTSPISLYSVISPPNLEFNNGFGSSVSQRQDNLAVIVGMPGYPATGGLVTYTQQSETQTYKPGPGDNLSQAAGLVGYGTCVEIGSSTWGVAGAPLSASQIGYAGIVQWDNISTFTSSQLLLALDQPGPARFGTSVSMSNDERWVYIGAPGDNSVYVYGRQDVETQSVSYISPGATTVFNVSALQFDYDTQLQVFLGENEQYLGQQWTLNSLTQIKFITAPAAGSTVTIRRRVAVDLGQSYYVDLAPTSHTGTGSDATFTISVVFGDYQPVITNPGTGYSLLDTLTFSGTLFGGTAPANNCVITVIQVGALGEVVNFTVTGSYVPGGGLPTAFDISSSLWGVSNNINSFTVFKNGSMLRPKLDYEYVKGIIPIPDSTDSSYILVLEQTPSIGDIISVVGGTSFIYVDKIQPTGLAPSANFGQSVKCGTDGQVILIGCPGDTVNGNIGAGSVYVYNRYTTTIQVTDVNQTTYITAAPLIDPTTVKLNGQILTNSLFYKSGQYTPGLSSVTLNVDLAIGDTIEIDTNQLIFVQKFTMQTADIQGQAAFGTALDLCSHNCSAYLGAPGYVNNTTTVIEQGLIDRFVNQARVYGIITNTNQNATFTSGQLLRINGYEIAMPVDNTLAGLAAYINTGVVPNVVAEVSNGYITIMLANNSSAIVGEKLDILPGSTGTVFQDIGFTLFVYTQSIHSPRPDYNTGFGTVVNISSDVYFLTAGAPNASAVIPVTFDNGTTFFDNRSTNFVTIVANSGVCYQYDYLPAANESVANPGQFVFGQQIYSNTPASMDQFGKAIDYTNRILLVGLPGQDITDSDTNQGGVQVFINANNSPSWVPIHLERPSVDVSFINSVSLYDRLLSTTNEFLDFFDPLQGKILGVCQRNLDYIGSVDPASYNTGSYNNIGTTWLQAQVGRIWWDTSKVRFLNPQTGDLIYALKRWGQIFPGSEVEIYQWIKSDVPPANYTGSGTPLSVDRYAILPTYSVSGVIQPVYYYWVKNATTIDTQAGKNLSTAIIAQYISNPAGSGISYLIPLSASAVGLVNSRSYISASDTILHLEFDVTRNDAVVHTEFDLIADGKEDSKLSDSLFEKLVDSLCGINIYGRDVPDTTVAPSLRYGVLNKPRQSMFIDRYMALKNFTEFSNRIMAQYPMSELNLSFSLLNSVEPEPAENSGDWNKRVENLEQLGWQNINIVPVGYKYLVAVDTLNSGRWTIYAVTLNTDGTRYLRLVQVQSYDTPLYWDYVNWYDAGYNPAIPPTIEVPIYAGLAAISSPYPGLVVRVLKNAQNKWEIYQYTTELTWNRVGLQDGTIRISDGIWDYAISRVGYDSEVFDSQYFDNSPLTETRKIVEAVFTEIFVGNFAIYVNQLTILLFDYILSEEQAPSWLMKTSLIDVTHKIRQLIAYPTYRRDNQDFVLQYLQEVKPYHVQLRQFDLRYSGFDEFDGDIADFDLPSRFDNQLSPPSYQSPILNINGEFTGNPAALPPTAALWQLFPYNQWYQNYLLELYEITVVTGGSGYTSIPTVTISGPAIRSGTAVAAIDSSGRVVSIAVTDPGEGYSQTPTIIISGGNGTGAQAVPRLQNQLVRNLNIAIKFDRYQYQASFVDWEPSVTYDNGTLVKYADLIWEASSPDSTAVDSAEFDPTYWTLIPPSQLSGVDRTMGYYIPSPIQPGRVLPLLIDGVEYPGVQVKGLEFSSDTGFDRDPFDNLVFDNYAVSAEGLPTYSDVIIDSIMTSQYLDSYIGTRSGDVIVDGGAYIDTYSSYAPEELVPGSEFDTLDFRVYTRPGADWLGVGHGFAISSNRQRYTVASPDIDFSGYLLNPITIELTNVTQTRDLNDGTDFTVNWTDRVITILSAGANEDDVIMTRVFGLGGGNQLYRHSYVADTEFDTETVVPAAYSEIQEFAVFINGVVVNGYSWAALASNTTLLVLTTPIVAGDYVSITAIGATPGAAQPRSWSDPQTQLITVTDGSQLTYDLTNSLQGTNPIMPIVSVNGLRARPYESVEYYADGSIEYLLPTRGGYSQGLISDNEIIVYVNNVLQAQGTDYIVIPWDGSTLRSIEFVSPLTLGETIIISVSHDAQYTISSNQITFKTSGSFGLSAGDIISATTWNDTSEQALMTYVWVGPVLEGTVTEVEPYDSTVFDAGTVLGDPGTFDYSVDTIVPINNLNLHRPPPVNTERLWVYYNGHRLSGGTDYSLETINNEVYISLPFVIGTLDVVSATICTQVTSPDAIAFRIFQDMRGLQTTYRITYDSTTEVAVAATDSDDEIFVVDASRLGGTNIPSGVLGVVTIGAERITYRERDLTTNSLRGLVRGTAGTSAMSHNIGAVVYDMSKGNELPVAYQDHYVSTTYYSDGQTVEYVLNIDLDQVDSSIDVADAIIVTIGGTLLPQASYTVKYIGPVTVVLDIAPPQGVEIVIAVLQGKTWYQPGINTPGDGVPLQLTDTVAAKFIRGN